MKNYVVIITGLDNDGEITNQVLFAREVKAINNFRAGVTGRLAFEREMPGLYQKWRYSYKTRTWEVV